MSLRTACLCASEPLRCMSDITAQGSITGSKATSSGEIWVILPTLLCAAPLFIPSTPRVQLLFHQWRRHAAVITLPPFSLSFFSLAVLFLYAGINGKILVLWVTLFFPFWMSWFTGLAVVFSLKRHLKLSDILYSDNHFALQFSFISSALVQKRAVPQLLLGESWLVKLCPAHDSLNQH